MSAEKPPDASKSMSTSTSSPEAEMPSSMIDSASRSEADSPPPHAVAATSSNATPTGVRNGSGLASFVMSASVLATVKVP
jgi:hypothetical protein